MSGRSLCFAAGLRPAPAPSEEPAAEEQPGGSEPGDGTPSTTTSPPRLGTVTLSGVGFTLDATTDTERLWAFGDDGEAALADLTTVLGEPVGDPGWGADARCTPPEVSVTANVAPSATASPAVAVSTNRSTLINSMS